MGSSAVSFPSRRPEMSPFQARSPRAHGERRPGPTAAARDPGPGRPTDQWHRRRHGRNLRHLFSESLQSSPPPSLGLRPASGASGTHPASQSVAMPGPLTYL
eukprot:6780308-Pyramimonas_sp.AAC.1